MFRTLRWPAKRLQSIVIAGCILGIVTPIGAMAISSTPSEAAIAVIDQRNIQEAIKTAIQTAKILTTEQKELALQILDAKKLSPKMLVKWLGKIGDGGGCFGTGRVEIPLDVLKEKGDMPAVLNVNTKAVEIFRNEIGTIEDAMTGKKTLYDLYMQSAKNKKALDATYQASAERAQASGKVTKQTQEVVKEAMEAAKNAEGEQQIMQAGIQIQGAQALQGADTNELLANILAMEAEKYYIENVEKATEETRNRAAGQKFVNFANK